MTREREEAIEELTSIRDEAKEGVSYVTECDVEILDMAIASLKTDEAYQLEYENRDFVEIHKGMTNGEVIQALFPKIELGEKVYNTRRYFLMGESIETFEFNTTDRWWNAPYEKECIKTLPTVEKESCRCNTCKNNDDELSGECYECVKGIFDHYEKENKTGV